MVCKVKTPATWICNVGWLCLIAMALSLTLARDARSEPGERSSTILRIPA